MADPLVNPEAIITLTVKRYLSVTQGVMTTSGANPDVDAVLIQDGNGRVRQQGANAFEVSGSNEHGNAPVDILFRVLPCGDYRAVDLVVKNLQNIPEGGPSWDTVRVGSGTNDHEVTVTDKARKQPATTSITYGVYVLIKPKAAAADYPVGDVGVIDPFITNR
jgi:hypothetical protein